MTKPTDKNRSEAFDPESLDGQAQTVRHAWDAHTADDERHSWPVEVYEDHVIVERSGEYFRYGFTIDGDEITFDDEPTEVKPRGGYEPVTESRFTELRAGRILESLDQGEGYRWRVTMIRPGVSKNGTRYRPEVLSEAVELYEGTKAFDGHRSDSERRSSGVARMVGFHENVTVGDAGELISDFVIGRNAAPLRDLFITAWESQRPDLIGFSHDVSCYTQPVVEGGRKITDVTKIAEVHSVDVVADPSAGGRLERLVASRQGGTMDRDEILALLDSDEELRGAVAAHFTPAEPVEDEPTTESKKKEVTETVTDDEPRLEGFLLRSAVREALAGTSLPDSEQSRLTEALTKAPRTEAEIAERVEESLAIWDAIAKSKGVTLPGQKPAVEVTEAEVEKKQKAIDAMLLGRPVDGVRGYRSLKEAFFDVTGRSAAYGDSEEVARMILAESVGAFANAEHRRISESVTSSTWSNALGDGITRRLIRDYDLNTAAFGDWRKIVDIVPVSDFRTQERERTGYYNVLSTVAEGDPYPALTSPSDEEATYSVTKKGGTEDLTIETITNDDLGVVRSIPRKLARAAALTIARAIWVTIIAGDATIYDSKALFHADHSNSVSDTFDSDGLNAVRNLLMAQTILGESSGALGAVPKYVIHPPELFANVHGVLNPAPGRTTNTPWYGLEPIEVALLTDAAEFFVVADPMSVPFIEVGFLGGREEPELFVQDAPAVGSVFTADKITYKARHTWGVVVVDYRGIARGT